MKRATNITAWDRRYCQKDQRQRVHFRKGSSDKWICIGNLPGLHAKCGDPVLQPDEIQASR